MLAVARALVGSPRVLMLDEPSAGLSPKLVGEVFERLAAIRATGLGIVLVEQNVRAALALADRALILVEGRERPCRPRGRSRRRCFDRGALPRRRAPPGRGRLGVSPQVLVDGIVAGSVIGLGAIGVTLTYSILRFANFAHGEFISWGAYVTLTLSTLLAAASGGSSPIGPFSFTWPILMAGIAALALTGGLAPRPRPGAVPANSVRPAKASSPSWRASAPRSHCAASSRRSSRRAPAYFTRTLQIARPLGFGMRITPNAAAAIGTTAALVLATHLLLTRTPMGRAMRATAENPALARVNGIDVEGVIRATWLIGGALAGAAGLVVGLLVQVRPSMGFDLLLPLFAAAILGGIGSVPGAVLGRPDRSASSEAVAVAVVGAQWRGAVAFALLIAVLIVRPNGLFGARP